MDSIVYYEYNKLSVPGPVSDWTSLSWIPGSATARKGVAYKMLKFFKEDLRLVSITLLGRRVHSLSKATYSFLWSLIEKGERVTFLTYYVIVIYLVSAPRQTNFFFR
jgi:hypothetical protein